MENTVKIINVRSNWLKVILLKRNEERTMKKFLVFLYAVTFLFCIVGTAGAKSVLFSSKNLFYYNINYPQSYHCYGGDPWSTMTSILDAATGNDVNVVSDFENLDQMLNYDALFVCLRSRYIDPPISAIEIENISCFIETGRRVVLVGENPFWASWNEIILGIVGGSLNPFTPNWEGTHGTGFTSYSIVENYLTNGVDSIYCTGSLAIGGTQLFNYAVATLWGDNVLTVLTTNVFEESALNNADNKQFATNIANWIAYIDVMPVNHPPVANAGQNITVSGEEVATTTIQGTATDEDPDDVLEYRWIEGETVLLDWTPVGENGECPLDLSTISIEIGTHTLTLEVTDGQAISPDEMILTIKNSAPHAAPSGGGVYEVNTEVTLRGNVSDFDGDLLDYKWIEGTIELFFDTIQAIEGGTPVELPPYTTSDLSLGIHTIILQVDDGINDPVSREIKVEIVDTGVPTLAPVANQTILWPPNHKMVDIVIEANASDNSGLPVTLTAVVTSNEPVNGLGDGDMAPDWTEPIIDHDMGIINLQLRAERSGSGNGRVYTVIITATDKSNNSSTADVKIIVSHDKKKK